MKVLVTGFDPFGGETVNPAYDAVKLILNEINGYEIIKLEIPTVFKKSVDVIEQAILKYQPEIVLLVGQAGGRAEIAVERVGINIDDARIKDNESNQPIDETIYSDGENAYFSTLPIKVIVDELKRKSIPAVVSNSAGTYVCNHVFYGLMYLIEKKYPNIRGGFVHVPFLPSQVVNRPNTASMSVEMIKESLEIIIETTILNKTDIKSVGSSIY